MGYLQSDSRNLTMIMDFYELTMANGYFNTGMYQKKAVFDLFFRNNPDDGGFSIFAGLQQIVDYILNLHFNAEDIAYLRNQHCFNEDFLDYLSHYHFSGDVYAMHEGTIVYPNEPVITVVAPLIDCQLIETMILLEMNHQTLIATKANRIVRAALGRAVSDFGARRAHNADAAVYGETMILLEMNHQTLIATKANRIVRAALGRAVSDFGARRAHNADAAVYGARAAYIGGVSSSATVLSGQMFDIPVSGTMAHSWVMVFNDEYEAFKQYDEYEAFKQYALQYQDNCCLLVDTYDVLHSGVPNAIKVAKQVLQPLGKRLKSIRLDSGDLAYLSKKCRKMLDDAGLTDCKIVVSNSLDEYSIESLLLQGAKIDAFGVGERLITSKSHPVFGAVYKCGAIEENGQFVPKIKVSENVDKITNPGFKQAYRIYDNNHKAVADLLTLHDEVVDLSQPYAYVDPQKPWKNRLFVNCSAKKLLHKVIDNGQLVKPLPLLSEIKAYVYDQLMHEIWDEEQRFVNPHIHYMDMSHSLYSLKIQLLKENRKYE